MQAETESTRIWQKQNVDCRKRTTTKSENVEEWKCYELTTKSFALLTVVTDNCKLVRVIFGYLRFESTTKNPLSVYNNECANWRISVFVLPLNRAVNNWNWTANPRDASDSPRLAEMSKKLNLNIEWLTTTTTATTT